jgi:hypothetical protein
MLTALWTIFAVTVMLGVFAGCVIVVAAGLRWLEGGLAKRQRNPAM